MVSWGTRLREHARIPLYRSAYALTASSFGGAGLGVVFWAIATRTYPEDVVGSSTAAVASLMFLTGLAGLYLDGALYRFLPRAGEATGALLLWTFIANVAAAVAATTVFLLGLDLWAPALSFATSSPLAVLTCIAATVASCLLVLEDGALIGMRRAGLVPVKNIAFGLAKIALLLIVADFMPRYGILAAWVAPSIAFAVAMGYLLIRTLGPAHRALTLERADALDARRIAGYALGNYGGFLCMLAYRNLPPLLVLNSAGATASAFFYPPWLIASSALLVSTNLSTSLVVEGAAAQDQLALYTRQAIRQTARLVVPIAVLVFVAGPPLLHIFGAQYADSGGTLMRLLAVSLLPSSICVLSFGVARVQDHVRTILVNQVILAVLVLGLSALLLPPLGINGVGLGWLIAQTVVALILGATELYPLFSRGARSTEDGASDLLPRRREST